MVRYKSNMMIMLKCVSVLRHVIVIDFCDKNIWEEKPKRRHLFGLWVQWSQSTVMWFSHFQFIEDQTSWQEECNNAKEQGPGSYGDKEEKKE